jgi:hypothetical protein
LAAAFLTVSFAVFAGGAFTAALLVAVFLAAAFFMATGFAFAASARFAALAARAFARLATNAAFRAGDSFLFAEVFFAGAFCALWIASHRFFVAATIAALPALLSFRLGLGAASGPDGSVAFLEAAHRFRCASPIRFLAAALIFRRLGVAGSDVAAVSMGPAPDSKARSSAICVSMRVFCASKPSMAAVIISGVSLGVSISAFRNHPR